MARDRVRPTEPSAIAPHKWKALAFAVGVNLLFVAVLVFSVTWRNPKPQAVTAELYAPPVKGPVSESPPPPKAEPPKAEPRPEPPPPPKAVVEPPKPEPKVEPKSAPRPEPKAEPDKRAADIALKAKQEEEKKRREQAERDKVEAEKKRKEAEQKKADERRLAEEKKKADDKRAAEQRERQQREMDAMRAQADREMQQRAQAESQARAQAEQARAQADAQARANAESAARSRALNDYVSRVQAKVRGNVIVPPDMPGNPEAIFEVVQLPTGEIIDVQLRKSSGVRAYDEAVQRAILKSSPLPRPDRPDLFQRALTLKFRPSD